LHDGVVRVLVTGVSGVGKSALVVELRRREVEAYDADDHGFSEPRSDGRWGWRAERVAELLERGRGGVLVFAGASEEQAALPFDVRVLLTAPEPVLVARLRTRTTNRYGKSEAELAQVLADRREIEPLLRRSADLVIDTTEPVARVADRLLEYFSRRAR
jgi:dephospho-CoA kinase